MLQVVAALMGPLKNQLINQKTVILLCGSNIDLKTWNNLVLINFPYLIPPLIGFFTPVVDGNDKGSFFIDLTAKYPNICASIISPLKPNFQYLLFSNFFKF